MYYVYILYSPKFDKFYIGQTNDMANRLERHNNGYETYTSKFIPWVLKGFVLKESRNEALILEKKLKNLSKLRLIQFIEKYTAIP